MKRFHLVAAIGLVTLLVLGPNRALSSDHSLNEADLQKILTQACDEANDFYRNEHFPVLVPLPQKSAFSWKTDDDYKENAGLFQPMVESDDLVGAEILQASGRIIKFNNYAASHAHSKQPFEPGPPPPKWTQEHAIEVATKFAHIFLKSWNGYNLTQPVPKFEWPAPDGRGGAKPGDWMITWYRTSASGVRLFGDAVVVNISEKYGPMGIGIWLALHDDGKKITTIPKEQVLTEARKGLDQVLAWGSAKKWLPNSEIKEGPDEPILMMIQPNAVLEGNFNKAPSLPLETRPAWVVHYDVQSKNDPNARGTVTVYVDAQDGSFLGGSF